MIDQSTGLPSSSTDLGRLVTTFEYDSRGRLTWIKPQLRGDAWTEIDRWIDAYVGDQN